MNSPTRNQKLNAICFKQKPNFASGSRHEDWAGPDGNQSTIYNNLSTKRDQFHRLFDGTNVGIVLTLGHGDTMTLNGGWMVIVSVKLSLQFLPCRLLLYGRRKRDLHCTSGCISHTHKSREISDLCVEKKTLPACKHKIEPSTCSYFVYNFWAKFHSYFNKVNIDALSWIYYI